MSDRIILQHFGIDADLRSIDFAFDLKSIKYRNHDCDDVFAFREFSGDVSQWDRNHYGIECSLSRFNTLMNGSTNFQASISKLARGFVDKINYVFTTREELCCVRNWFFVEAYDDHEIYFNQQYEDCVRSTCNYVLDDEHDILKQELGRNTELMCVSNGVIPGQQPVVWNDTLSNITSSVCSGVSAAAVSSMPWLLLPTVLYIGYITDTLFGRLANWLTHLTNN